MAGITATSPAAVLNLVQRLDCKQADVLSDDRYSFSIQLDGSLSCIYQKDEDVISVVG
jgi:hypothetical protein